MIEITSMQNNYIKKIRKLTKKKYRVEHGIYLIEGEHLVEEALKSNVVVQSVLMTEVFLKEQLLVIPSSIEQYIVSQDIMESISSVPTPQGIIAVIKMENQNTELDTLKPILLLDNVQDPGNVGTMIRTADAAGFGTVILGEESADLYSDKVLRSMQGSHFNINVLEKNILDVINALKSEEIPIYGTELNPNAISYENVQPSNSFALVMGNEGQGVSKDILSETTNNLYIPIIGQAESLNVAVAAGILMFSLKV